jgi:hypothetical protein
MTNAVDAITRVVREHGPLTIAEVVERLKPDGIEVDEIDVLRIFEMNCPAGELTDHRWVWLPTLLAGRVFTHRVTAAELEHDVLAVQPDLGPVADLCEYEGYEHLADGSPVSVVVADFDDELLEERGIPLELVDVAPSLLLAAGTLSGLGAAAGELVGVRLTDDGLVVERVTDALPGVTEGDRLVDVLADDDMTFLDSAVWTVCLNDPSAFTKPVAPLDAILDERGLVRNLDSVAPPGFDVAGWRFDLRCERLAMAYELEQEDALALGALIEVYEKMSHALVLAGEDAEAVETPVNDDSGPDAAYLAMIEAVGPVLGDPYLAGVLRLETVEKGGSPAALGLFAETLESQVPRRARVAYRWLRAVAHERMGDIDTAEREFLAAESMDPDWVLPLLDLARFASDRGDAERGIALLHRAGVDDDHPVLQLLERHRATPRTDVGRNEPCWCGSGRKYKKCHLGREGLPLDDRLQWLYAKAYEHAVQTSWRELLDEIGIIRAAYASSEDETDAMANDPLVIDAVLFEGGAFEEFVAQRGYLLPDDERALAEQWLLTERSVFEVGEVTRGRSMILRDVRTGDVCEVREQTASKVLKPGELICTHVVPAAEGSVIFGGVERVGLHYRNALIELLDSEPDAEDLVEFLTLPYAPPTMVNAEGEELAGCEATLRVPPGVEELLEDAYERVDDNQWCERREIEGEKRIRVVLHLEGDTLTVSANSEARMDRALATLTLLDPSITVLSDERKPVGDLSSVPLPPGEIDPAAQTAIAEYVADYEKRWLDMSIPALEGLTPRQAADDPTRRGDLIRLLDSFPNLEGGMSAQRLRAALGLS